MNISTDDANAKRLEKLRRDRLLRVSGQMLSGVHVFETTGDLPAFLSKQPQQHGRQGPFVVHAVSGLAVTQSLRRARIIARVCASIFRRRIKQAINTLRQQIAVVAGGSYRLLARHLIRLRSAVQDHRDRQTLLEPYIFEPTEVHAAAAVGLVGIAAGLIFFTPGHEPQAISRSLPRSVPVSSLIDAPHRFDPAPDVDPAERLDFGQGLRERLAAGGLNLEVPPEPLRGEVSDEMSAHDRSSAQDGVAGILLADTGVLSGTVIAEAPPGLPQTGHENFATVLPPAATEAFFTSLELLAANLAQNEPVIAGSKDSETGQGDHLRRQPLRPNPQRRRQPVQPAPASLQNKPSPIATGSIASPSAPAPSLAPPLFFLGLLAPQPVDDPPPQETEINKSWLPESMTDVFKNSY
jgi:hypothetical protein